MHMQIIRHIPNTITSMNLISGTLGVIFTLQGHIEIAFPLMLLAAVFDFFDGGRYADMWRSYTQEVTA